MIAEIVNHYSNLALFPQFRSIPLPGIDVPFHSRYLWAGVMPFRAYLSRKLNPAHMNPELLIDKYIPNLTAEPFQISKAYAERIYQQTNSPRLEKTLKNWVEDGWDLPENRSKLGYVIIVELLAYQFASFVPPLFLSLILRRIMS